MFFKLRLRAQNEKIRKLEHDLEKKTKLIEKLCEFVSFDPSSVE
jgi:hypothetical protein